MPGPKRRRQGRAGFFAALALEPLEGRRLLTRIAIIGDYSSDVQTAPTRDVSNLVKSWSPDAIATVGDNNYPDGGADTIDSNVGQWYHDYISPYSGGYGSGSSTGNRFWPAIGNHDYNSTAKYKPYTDYFTLPNNERYYTQRIGDIQLFVINDDSHEPDGTSATSTQGKWIQGQLAASTVPYKLVLLHHPPYSSGGIGSNTYTQWPFQAWGATAVIAGHDHDYERIVKNGFTYLVDGLGGESIVGFGSTVSGSQVRYAGDYGALKVDSTSTALNLQFVTRGGQVIDTFSLAPTTVSPPPPPPPPGTTFVAANSTWKYLDNGSNQGTAWRAQTFDDGAWKSGSAELGYGDGDEATTVSYGSNANSKFITTYFRKSFSVSNASSITALSINLVRDDGAVIYVNGTEAWRSNMPTGTISSTTAASTAVGGSDESTFFTQAISPSLLVNGTNEIAVEIHQSSGDSSDISFNLSLTGQGGSTSVTAPAAPSALAATASGQNSINLSWADNSSNEDGFRIERSANGSTGWIEIATTAAGVTTLSNTGLTAGTTYFYRVRAYNAAGTSVYSNTASATTATATIQPPAAPSNLAATAISASQINLTWTDNSSNESGFKIERSPDGTSGWAQVGTSVNAAFSDSAGLAPGTKYFYRVRATNSAGDSPYSNTASATTTASSSVVYLSDLAWASMTNGWGPVEKDQSVGGSGTGDGKTITLNGVPYAKGLGAHAISDVTYNLGGAYSTFLSDVGVDDETGPGTVVFQVFADGTKIYDSGVMTQTAATKSINVSVAGVQQLRLHVDDGGDGADYDHADWANARLQAGGTGVTPPSAPSGATATAVSSTQVNLSWVDTSTNESGFHVYRLINGTYTLVGSPTGTSFQDTGLSPQTTYSYRVFAYNFAGESSGFSSASATTPAATGTSLPTPWTDGDVGAVSPAGSASYSGGTFTVSGSGNDIWFNADGFNFAYQPMTGDGTIIAKVTGVTNTNGWAKAGVMMRETLSAGAKEAAMHVTPTNGTVMTYRTTTGAASDGDFASGAAPYWVKLTRSGGTFTGYRSTDGVSWTQVGTINISMASTIYVGLCVTSKSATAAATGTFTNVTVNGVTNTAVAQPVATATAAASTFSVVAVSPMDSLEKQDVLDALTV